MTIAPNDIDFPQASKQDNRRPADPVQVPPDLSQGDVRKLAVKQLLPAVLTLFVAYLIIDKARHLDFAAIRSAAQGLSAAQWMFAAIASVGSFWAVGRYDGVLHAQLGTGISPKAARRSGITAIAFSQAVGFGALTGALVRWRMLPEMTLWQSLRLSAAVALSFLAGWAVFAAIAVLVVQPDVPWMKSLAFLAVTVALFITSMSIWPPGRLARVPWPTLRTMGTVIALAAMDTGLAALALFSLLPASVIADIGHLLVGFLFALGAGLVGSTPGGIGPFEATLVGLLPDQPIEPVLAGIIAFRALYYAVPASVAALFVLRGPKKPTAGQGPRIDAKPRSPFLPPMLEAQLFAAPRAEANLLRTRDFALLKSENGETLGLTSPVGQSLVMISDPIKPNACPAHVRTALSRAARARYRLPALYKCGARMASSARNAGWAVLPVAREAWLSPATFDLEGSKRRQLRRLLRKSEEAGVTITEGGRQLPIDDMRAVAAAWKQARGGERGFSMGTFCPDYIACQRIFLAHHDGQLIAFVTFHETRNEFTLDLMRAHPDAPDGTMQALIVAAIAAARAYGCPRLSLAAAPWDGTDDNALVAKLRRKFLAKSGAEGLRRFKSAFGPHWEVLYIAAPNRIALAVCALDILRRVTAPPRSTPSEAGMKVAGGATHPVARLLPRLGKARGSRKT